MQRCPLCRATLDTSDTCRRCRADLHIVRRVEREAQALVNAAMHKLSLGDEGAAADTLERALALHATPPTKALWHALAAARQAHASADRG